MTDLPITFIADFPACLACEHYEDCKAVLDTVDAAARRGAACASREGRHPVIEGLRPVCEEREAHDAQS